MFYLIKFLLSWALPFAAIFFVAKQLGLWKTINFPALLAVASIALPGLVILFMVNSGKWIRYDEYSDCAKDYLRLDTDNAEAVLVYMTECDLLDAMQEVRK